MIIVQTVMYSLCDRSYDNDWTYYTVKRDREWGMEGRWGGGQEMGGFSLHCCSHPVVDPRQEVKKARISETILNALSAFSTRETLITANSSKMFQRRLQPNNCSLCKGYKDAPCDDALVYKMKQYNEFCFITQHWEFFSRIGQKINLL